MVTYHEVFGTLKDYLEFKSDHVLLHDDLEDTSRPFYFQEILDLLPAHDLTYLADASFPSNLLFGLNAEEAAWLKQVASTFEETEQYLDFLRNRTFRTSLLVHDSATFTRSVSPLPIANFYASSYVRRTNPQPEGITEGAVHFSAVEGLGFVTDDPIVIAALDLLVEAEGAPVIFRDLVRRARERAYAYSIPGSTLDEDAHKVATTLLSFYSKSINMLEFTTLPGPYLTTLSERPVASRYARYQAISADTVTNMRHNRVSLSANARALISLLDGTNTRERLIDTLLRMTLQPEGVAESERREKMAEEVDRLMDRFRVAALLVG
jgi:methyltransferase-like protein